MSETDLTIVITTFKSEHKIEQCLKSIDSQVKVILVENSSSIEFKKKIENKFKNVTCDIMISNLGYGKANNIGLKKVKTNFALILNPDTVLTPNSLKNFFQFVKKNKDFTIIGPNQSEKIENFKNSNYDKLEFVEVDKIKGYAMFLNMEKLKKVGFFDENFFLYLEEIDLCKRVKDLKQKICICKNIIIFHQGGNSVNKKYSQQIELTRNWHWMWSLFYYNRKHYGYLVASVLIFPKLISSISKVIFYFLLLNKKNKDIYYNRFSGIINSMMGKKSWYRPFVD